MLPALALRTNSMLPGPFPSAATKFCIIPELFVIPVLMVNLNIGLAVIVNALAPELNVMPSTVVSAEIETPVILERANVALSPDAAFGATPVSQLAPVFQSPELGAESHVASF
jgi:hypothetical protein